MTSFPFTKPHFSYSNNFKNSLIALLISCIIIVPVLRTFNSVTIISIILMSIIIFIILSTMTSDALGNSVPLVTYPPPPHLGLDGVSLDNAVAGFSPNT